MNNQPTTMLILVCLIALFSLRHHTLQINQTSQGTDISFGNISLSFGGPETADAQSPENEAGCIMEYSDPSTRLIPAETATLTAVSVPQLREIEIIIETLPQAYDLQNRRQEYYLRRLNHTESNSDLNHHP